MPRFLKIVMFVVLTLGMLVVAAGVGGVLFLRNLDVMKFKPQIVQAAHQALGRTMDFEDAALQISLQDGVRVHLTGLSIEEDPAFGSEAFVKVGEAEARVDLLAFLTARQIVLPEVMIRGPQIHLIRRADGVLNVQSLGSSQGKISLEQTMPTPDTADAVQPAAASVPSAIQGNLPPIFIHALSIEDAEIALTDQEVSPPVELALHRVNLTVREFSLAAPFDLHLDAAVLGEEENLTVDGQVQLRLLKSAAELTDFEIKADLRKLDWATVRALPHLKGIPLPQTLSGEVTAALRSATVSAQGLGQAVVDLDWTDGIVKASDIVPGVSVQAQGINLQVQGFSPNRPDSFHVELKAALYQDQPNVDFIGEVAFDAKTGAFSLTQSRLATDFALWPLAQMKEALAPLKAVPLPDRLLGKWQTTIQRLEVSSQGLVEMALDAKWEGGAVTLSQGLPGPPLALDKIDVALNDFALGRPFLLSLRAAYHSAEPNLSFEGNLTYHPDSQALDIKDAVSNVDLDHLALGDVKDSGFIPAGTPWPESWGGKIHTVINDLAVTPQGVQNMSVDAQWQEGQIVFQEVVPGISLTANRINFSVKDFSLGKAFDAALSLGLESEVPNLSLQGRIFFDPLTKKTRLQQTMVKADLAAIPWSRLQTTLAPLKDQRLPETLAGQLEILLKDLTMGEKGLEGLKADITLRNGEIRMDQAAPGVALAASHMEASIQDFSLDQPFTADVRMAYLHESPNLHAQARIALGGGETRVTEGLLETDLGTWDLKQLKASIAALKDVFLPEGLKGLLDIRVSDGRFGSQGVARLNSVLTLKDWSVGVPGLLVPVSGENLSLRLTERNADLDPAQVRLGSGTAAVKGSVRNYTAARDFSVEAEVKAVRLAEVIDQSKAQVKVEGLLGGTFKAQGQGADTSTITGYGTVEAKEAVIRNLNVLKTVLDKISFLPNVAARVQASLPEKYQAKLEDKDTVIDKAMTVCAISGGVMTLDPIQVEADTFTLGGKGRAGLGQDYAMDGAFKIPAELSAAMTTGVAELQYLYDTANNISLPVHIAGRGGKAPSVSVTQTALDITKGALRNEGKMELKKVLNKVLGQESVETAPEGQTPESSGDPANPSPSVGDQIIDGIFDTIFR